jgi:signal peptidase I
MDPLIDAGTTTIEVKPKYASEIKVGDIVAYDVKGYDYAFVHRVADIGNDAEGVYFVTKGDNYWQEDPDKVRFSDIEGIVVGILY